MAGLILYADGSGVYHRPMTERIIASLVPPESNGKQLISHLCERFTYCSQAEWQAFIDSGCLLVDGRSALADQRLARGQYLEFKPSADLEPAVDTAYSIVYENSRLLVVYKPPLLPIHPSGRFFANTLWYLLSRDVGHVHIATRLDRETSGLVLLARDAETARFLQEQQGLGAIHKTYLAMVHGNFPAGQTRAKGWLIPDKSSEVRKKRRFLPCLDPVVVYRGSQDDQTSGSPEPGGESCETLLSGRASWQDQDGWRSLVEAQLLSGRNHQIRASLHSLGYPLVGDKLYGLDDGFFLRFIDNALTPQDRSRLVLPYQALHCAKLEFHDPEGNSLAFSSPAPWAGLVKSTEL